jgi:CubicO group peptidase (beta-lactamase class C family)
MWYRISVGLLCITMLALSAGRIEASPAGQGEPDFAAVDAYVAEQLDELGIPGMALGVVQDGQVVHLQGFGVADASGRAVTPQTPFYLGSVTKSFTALAVMQLVEANKVNLDAPVQTYLSWLELADQDAAAKITVRHLLNQTSGISEKDGNRFWSRQQGIEEAVRGLDRVRLAHPVGTTYEYSNLNYIIAGLVVEVVSGQYYADYVAEHIFEPLDMRHSYASRELALADGLSDGHYYMYGRVFRDERRLPPGGLPQGFLMASAEDMSHFAMAQLDEGRYGTGSILSPQGIAEMHAPAVPKGNGAYWGIGWDVGTLDGKPAVWRLGDTGHFHADILLLPESELGVVLLANASGYEQLNQVDQVAVGVLSLLAGKPPAPVVPPAFGPRFLYWAIAVSPLLQILGLLVVWRKRRRIKAWGVLLTVALNLGLVGLLLGLGQLVPFRLPSLLVFFPEVGYGLIAVAALGIGWSVIYTAVYLRMHRAKT